MASRIRRFNIDLISVDQRSPEDAALARALDNLHQQAAWLSHDAERLRAYLSSTGPSYRLRESKGNDLGTFASSTGPYASGDRIVFGRRSEWIVDEVEGDTLTLRAFGAVA
jgi:hypothetical protein